MYITLLPVHDGIWEIKILGAQMDNIMTAKAQLQTVIHQVQTDTTGLQHTLDIVLDEREGLDVVIEVAELWWPNHNDRLVPRLLPNPMMDTPRGFQLDSLDFRQLKQIKSSFQAALEAVRSRKGCYDFAVRLGCLALSSKKVTEMTPYTVNKEHFIKGMSVMFRLDVKKWLADHTMGNQILRAIMSAEHLLEPTKSAGYYGRLPKSLRETQPVFRGMWVFSDPSVAGPLQERHAGRPSTSSTTEAPLVVVQVDWTDDEGGLYEKGTPRYYRPEQGKKVPKMHMDINLLELGKSRGWHFALESLIPVSPTTVSPLLRDFAARVRMRDGYDVSSHEAFAVWDNTPTIKKCLITARSDIVYSFGIKKTSYKVEVTGMWYPGQKPAWGLCVRHFEWATHLAELERLAMGHKATWGDTVTTFLPDDGHSCHSAIEEYREEDEEDEGARDGIRILTDKLSQLSTLVSSITDMAGGVSI